MHHFHNSFQKYSVHLLQFLPIHVLDHVQILYSSYSVHKIVATTEEKCFGILQIFFYNWVYGFIRLKGFLQCFKKWPGQLYLLHHYFSLPKNGFGLKTGLRIWKSTIYLFMFRGTPWSIWICQRMDGTSTMSYDHLILHFFSSCFWSCDQTESNVVYNCWNPQGRVASYQSVSALWV